MAEQTIGAILASMHKPSLVVGSCALVYGIWTRRAARRAGERHSFMDFLADGFIGAVAGTVFGLIASATPLPEMAVWAVAGTGATLGSRGLELLGDSLITVTRRSISKALKSWGRR